MQLNLLKVYLLLASIVTLGFTERLNSGLLWFNRTNQNFAVWAPFGEDHPDAVRFQDWVTRAKPGEPLVAFNNHLVLNCWEYVLYTSLKLKSASLEAVQAHYAAIAQGKPLRELLGSDVGVVSYKIKNGQVKLSWPIAPQAGDVIFMDGESHVVQVTGQRNAQGRVEVVSFSPRPIWGDGSRYWAEPDTRPEVTSIESLIEEMIDLYPDVPTDWNKIELKIIRPHQASENTSHESLSTQKRIAVDAGEFKIEAKWKKIKQTSDEVDVLFGRVQFTPKVGTSFSTCNNISFVQVARVLDNTGSDYQWPLGQEARNRMKTKKSEKGVVGGFFIDHDASKCEDDRACSLFYRDSWPNSADGSRDGNLTARRASPAILIDYPFGWEIISSISLEACAVCRDNMKVYGCATWGGSWPPIGQRTVHDLGVSNLPSLTFLDAVQRFKSHYRQ
jgi:hypothetical protein